MDSYLGLDHSFLERLEKMSQEHEKAIVIDLSIERLIRFMGTYGIGVLAIAAAAFIILGISLSHQHSAQIFFHPIILHLFV